MSKNFRSSFIDLLCCHYPKESFFGVSESLRTRRLTDSNNNNRTSLYGKGDCMMRTSVVTRSSQLSPMLPPTGPTTSSSLTPITNELSRTCYSGDDRNTSTENTSTHLITVELSEAYRRSK